VMLHGSPGDHYRSMAQVEPSFKGRSGWRRIYPDLPGHGRTAGTDRVRSMDDYLDVLVEFVDRVTRRRRFALGGSSFGAYLALRIARRRASKLDGLLLAVPEISHSPLGERRDAAFVADPMKTLVELVPGRPYVEDTAWLEALPFRDVRHDAYRRTEPVTTPALFLFGRQDSPYRYRAYWRLLPDFPHATFAVLDAASHALWTDRRELVCELVRDWLDRVESTSYPHTRVRSRRHE
jgi:pimeloyl-ACP methyl ester carboxylesterase